MSLKHGTKHSVEPHFLLSCGIAPLLPLYLMAGASQCQMGFTSRVDKLAGSTKQEKEDRWSIEGDSVENPQNVFLKR